MSDPFAAYAKRATTKAPPRLIGAMRTRAEARTRYAEIVANLNRCQDSLILETYIASIKRDLAQFAAELEWLWEGDDDFRGLRKEIEWARARVDDGLDYPRWEPGQTEAEEGLRI